MCDVTEFLQHCNSVEDSLFLIEMSDQLLNYLVTTIIVTICNTNIVLYIYSYVIIIVIT